MLIVAYKHIDSESNIYAKGVYNGDRVGVGCGKRCSIDRRLLDGDRDAERVKPRLIGMVAIPSLS